VGFRIHRQHVDDVGPVVDSFVTVAEQLRSDRVAVGLVADQDATEVVASLRVERLKDRAEIVTRLRTGQGVGSRGIGSRGNSRPLLARVSY
jgi:hypothetical protein